MTIRSTIELLKEAQQKKSSLKIDIVLNMVIRVNITEEAKEQLSQYDMSIIEIKEKPYGWLWTHKKPL